MRNQIMYTRGLFIETKREESLSSKKFIQRI
jgi:hypothetical protein